MPTARASTSGPIKARLGLPTNIIFTHGGDKYAGAGDASDKGVEFKNHGYYVETKYAKE